MYFDVVAVNQDRLTGFALFIIGHERDATKGDSAWWVLKVVVDTSQGDLQIVSRRFRTRNVHHALNMIS